MAASGNDDELPRSRSELVAHRSRLSARWQASTPKLISLAVVGEQAELGEEDNDDFSIARWRRRGR